MSGPAPSAPPIAPANPAWPASAHPTRPHGRSLGDFGRLSVAERKLLDCCRRGEAAMVTAARPRRKILGQWVRADFVRFLILGGDERAPVHEHGVSLCGAWLIGPLDLAGAKVTGKIELRDCRLERIIARGAQIHALDVSGSWLLRGCSADGLQCERNMVFSLCRIRGGLDLSSAGIGGSLNLNDAHLSNYGDLALSLESGVLKGSLFFTGGFTARGRVSLINATIDGALDCSGASFSNPGDKDYALSLDSVRVGTTFQFRKGVKVAGWMDLAAMRVATLCDDAESWKAGAEKLALDGFIYDRLAGSAPTDADARVEWLCLQRPDFLGAGFRPQPWEQLIAVLRAMGHPEEARKVAIAKQRQLRRSGRLKWWIRPLHLLYGGLVGYGYRPMWLLGWMAATWLGCAAAYWAATNPASFGAETYLLAPPPAESGRSARPPDYRNFVPLIYSADVLLPVVDLGYKKEWQPVVADRAGNPLIWGQLLRFLYWFEIAFGWVAGLLLVGVLGNLIKKD